MTTTPTPRPVPTTEDRMMAAITTTDVTGVAHAASQPKPAADPRRDMATFATYLDRTERDQLDARAATAEAERDDALNDRDAYREARDVLRKQLNAMKAAKKRALGRLEKAEHVIDLIRGGQEQIDRALAVYDTTPGETCSPPCTLPKGHQRECDANEQPAPRHPGDALADALRNAYSTEQLATLHEDLVHELDDDAPPENPLGRLVDALFAARWQKPAPVLGSPADRAQEPTPAVIDAAHLARQRAFSERTFGPGPRTEGVLDHIRKELKEIEAAPDDLGEWIDVVILALDGAWRAGHEPQQIIDATVAKQARNEARTWPDWRTADPGRAIEHDRSTEREG